MNITFGCCFCDKDIEGQPFSVTLFDEATQVEQTWFCHKECFLEKLHKDYLELRPEWREAEES